MTKVYSLITTLGFFFLSSDAWTESELEISSHVSTPHIRYYSYSAPKQEGNLLYDYHDEQDEQPLSHQDLDYHLPTPEQVQQTTTTSPPQQLLFLTPPLTLQQPPTQFVQQQHHQLRPASSTLRHPNRVRTRGQVSRGGVGLGLTLIGAFIVFLLVGAIFLVVRESSMGGRKMSSSSSSSLDRRLGEDLEWLTLRVYEGVQRTFKSFARRK